MGDITLRDAIVFLVQHGPGRTEAELAGAIFGKAGYQQRVNPDCRLLVGRGTIVRRGEGGLQYPYRYFPAP